MQGFMTFLALLAFLIAFSIWRVKGGALLQRFVLWTGMIWTAVFGVMVFDHYVAAVLPHLGTYTGVPWQPIGPCIMGVIVLGVYAYLRWTMRRKMAK